MREQKKHGVVPLIASCLLLTMLAAPLAAQQVRCIETFTGLPIEDFPSSVSGHCGTFYGGAVRNFTANDWFLLGGKSYCAGVPHVYCDNSTKFIVPVGSNAEFDLLPGPTTTLVQAEGFSQRYPDKPTLNVDWVHVVLPPTANNVTVTTFGGFVPPSYILPSTHVIDNVAFDRVGPPRFEFEYDEKQPGVKLLLHKYMPNDVSAPFQGYWSSYQVQSLPPDASPQIRVPGVLKQGQSGVASTIWARVIDPPDTASYVPAQLRLPDDNRDTQHRKGTLFYYDASGNRVNQDGAGVLTMRTDSGGVAGRAEILLEASHDVAGENYQVEVSTDQYFTCATSGLNGADVCAKSAVFTTWKRVYVETRQAFRKGAFVAVDTPAGATTMRVRMQTNNPPPFASGQVIRLLHGGTPAYYEDVAIDVDRRDANNHIVPAIQPSGADYDIRLATALLHSYSGIPQRRSPQKGPIYLADAVGVPGSYFEADSAAVPSFYSTMFVDVQPLRNVTFSDFPAYDYPYVDNGLVRFWLARRFSEFPDPNVVHLFGAGAIEATTGPGNPCTTDLGLTTASNSYVFVANIEQAVIGPIAPCQVNLTLLGHNLKGLKQGVTAHEMTHQWEVNHIAGKTGGHCQEHGSLPPGTSGDLCLMNNTYPSGVTNWYQVDAPLLSLHWLGNGTDSEYIEIRTHAEPVH